MTSFVANDFVAKGDPAYLIEDGEGYELRLKKRSDKTVVELFIDHDKAQELIFTKVNPKAMVWKKWTNKTDKDGNEIKTKSGQTMGSYVPV